MRLCQSARLFVELGQGHAGAARGARLLVIPGSMREMESPTALSPLPYRRFSLAERDRRWAAVRRLMARDGLAAIFAPNNPGNSTDWQADSRYLSQCGGGADA